MAGSKRARCAIYARYSTALQNPRSIEDQVALCRRHLAERDVVVTVYADRARTGTSMHRREGLAALRRACDAGEVDVVLAEALDRISRDLADLATLYKFLAHRDVVLETVEEGVVGSLHVGLKGIMNEEFVTTLAAKVRRGQDGNIRAGKSASRVSYGYRAAPRIEPDGRVVRGLREIVPEQAEIVRRIFRQYAEGRSASRIAAELNAEGVPAPGGGEWGARAITGNHRRGGGILCNELYRGVLTFGRTRRRRDPGTGQWKVRAVDRSEWTRTEVDELRIVDDDLWDRVRLRREASRGRGTGGGWGSLRPLTVRMRCGHCGGRMTIHAAGRYSCVARRQRMRCDFRGSILADAAEAAALARLGEFVAHGTDWPATLERADERLEIERNAIRKRIAGVERRLGNLIESIELGDLGDTVRRRVAELEREIAGFRVRLRDLEGVAGNRRPARELWNRLQSRAELLARATAGDDPQARLDALLVVRGLVARIEVSRGRTARKPAIAVTFDEAALIAMALRDGPDADVLRRGAP